MTSIGDDAFTNCGSLNISVDNGNKNFCDIDGVLFSKDKTEILAYAKDEIQSDYTIPDNVTSISDGAFYDCRNLTSINIPRSITSITIGCKKQGREIFVSAIRRFMKMEYLTAPILRELIDHIDVYETEGTGKNRTQRIIIYYRFVGYIELPSDKTYKAETRKGVAVEYIPAISA